MTRVCKLAIVAVFGTIIMPAAALARNTMADCTKFVDGWKSAYNARNAEALANMYEPDNGTYSNVFWTGTGHAALLQSFKQEFSVGNTITSITCASSEADGDHGVSAGTWSAAGLGPDGKPMRIDGHWQTTVTGHDGHYLIVDHISNIQLPSQK